MDDVDDGRVGDGKEVRSDSDEVTVLLVKLVDILVVVDLVFDVPDVMELCQAG